MAMNIADFIVGTLASAGIGRIWGITGDSLNAFNDSLRKQGDIRFMHVRNEEAAAFAAGADAASTGRLAVCAGSCGPGNLHLINGLFDCHRSRVPVLAIASHIPSSEIGLGYFQETHPTDLFRECSAFCEMLTNPAQLPELLDRAIRTAIGTDSVAVLVVPGDVTMLDAPKGTMLDAPKGKIRPFPALRPPRILPDPAELDALVVRIDAAKSVTILGGAGCAGAHDEVVALADRLAAPIVHAYRGKEHLEWDNPFDVGMTGLIGFTSGYHAMKDCDLLLVLGSGFPYRNFYPKGVDIVQIDRDPTALGRHATLSQAIVGDVRETVLALAQRVGPDRDRAFLDKARKHYATAREDLDALATPRKPGQPLHPQFVARTLDRLADEDAIFTVDVGTVSAWAARYVHTNGKRRLISSLVHGSMASALPQALGAQGACPDRQVISMSGDGGLAMLMGELLTAVQLDLPIKIVVFNNGTLGFVELEMKAAGYVDTNVSLKNPDFGAIAKHAGLKGFRVETSEHLEPALREAFAHPGPALVDVVTATQELIMPPAIKAEQAAGFSLYSLRTIMNGRGDELLELATTNLLR